MTKLIGTTRQAAEYFGFQYDNGQPNTRAFLNWASRNNILPAHGKKHHFWWNFKIIEQLLDRGVLDQSLSSETDHFKNFMEDLHGEHQGAVPH